MKNGRLLATPLQPDAYTGPTYPAHIQMMEMKPSYIDSVAIVVDTVQGTSIRLSILNRHPTADWKARIAIPDFGKSTFDDRRRADRAEVSSAEVHEMYSDDLDAVVSLANL